MADYNILSNPPQGSISTVSPFGAPSSVPFNAPPAIPSRTSFAPSGGSSGNNRTHKHLHTNHATGEADQTNPFSDNEDIIFYLLRADQDTGGDRGKTFFQDPDYSSTVGGSGSGDGYDNLAFVNRDVLDTGPYIPNNLQSEANSAALAFSTGEYTENFEFDVGVLGGNALPVGFSGTGLGSGSVIGENLLSGGLQNAFAYNGIKSVPDAIQKAEDIAQGIESITPSTPLERAAGRLSESLVGGSPFTAQMIGKALLPESLSQPDPSNPFQASLSIANAIILGGDDPSYKESILNVLRNTDSIDKPVGFGQKLTQALSGLDFGDEGSELSRPQQISQLLVQIITGYDLTNPQHIHTALENDPSNPVNGPQTFWSSLFSLLGVEHTSEYNKLLSALAERYVV